MPRRPGRGAPRPRSRSRGSRGSTDRSESPHRSEGAPNKQSQRGRIAPKTPSGPSKKATRPIKPRGETSAESSGEASEKPAFALLTDKAAIARAHRLHAENYRKDGKDEKAREHDAYAAEAEQSNENTKHLKVLGHLANHHANDDQRARLEAERQKHSASPARLTKSQRKQQKREAKTSKVGASSDNDASEAKSARSEKGASSGSAANPAAAMLQGGGSGQNSGHSRVGQVASAANHAAHGAVTNATAVAAGLANGGMGAARTGYGVAENAQSAGVAINNSLPGINQGGTVTLGQSRSSNNNNNSQNALTAGARNLGLGGTSGDPHVAALVAAAQREAQERK